DPFAVGARRPGRPAVLALHLFGRPLRRERLPELFAVVAAQAHDGAAFAVVVGGGQEDAVLEDDRRRVAAAWQRRLVDDVVGGGPLLGVGAVGHDVLAAGAAPARPVFRGLALGGDHLDADGVAGLRFWGVGTADGETGQRGAGQYPTGGN